MKKILACLISLSACSLTAQQFDPMLEFSSGNYLGLGRYTNQEGRTEFYSSFGMFSETEWSLAYNSGIGTSFYNLFFEFDQKETGSFNFIMMRETPGPGSGFYTGYGYCGSHQCHLLATLENNFLEETITFNIQDNHINRLGSLHTQNEDGSSSIIWWDEKMNYIGALQDDDGYEEGIEEGEYLESPKNNS